MTPPPTAVAHSSLPIAEGVYAAAAEGGSPSLAISGRNPGTVVWANEAALHLLGLTADEVIGAALVADDSLELGGSIHWTAAVAATLNQQQLDPADADWIDARLEGPGRSVWPVQVRVKRVRDDLSVIWLRPASAEVRLAEAAQRESEHRFRALAEHAPIGILVSEAGLRLGFANTRLGEIVGVDANDLTGIRWLRSVHPDDLPMLLTTVDEVLAGETRELSVRLIRDIVQDARGPADAAADSHRWVQIRLAPVLTPRRSAGFIGTVEDVTDRRAWENQLSYIAGHDALTGLANRRSLIAAVTQLLLSRRDRDRDAAVLFCDLDGFKQINDTFGHEAGDRVLVEVGQRLLATARDNDLVARIAGDEFVVLLRDVATYTEAEIAVVRQLDGLRTPIYVAGSPVQISVSIGVAMARDYDTATQLLQAADRGMYDAKRTGPGHYRRGRAEGKNNHE